MRRAQAGEIAVGQVTPVASLRGCVNAWRWGHLSKFSLRHHGPNAGMVVLPTVFSHAWRIGLDVPRAGYGIDQRRIEQPEQTRIRVHQKRLRRVHGLAHALRRGGARKHSPGLCNQVDATFCVVSSTQRLPVIKKGPFEPLSIPGLVSQ